MLHPCGHRSNTRRCSCRPRCGGGAAASFSIFFPVAGCGKLCAGAAAADQVFDCSKSLSSGAASRTMSSVDCTLSLGTPSTRASSAAAARPPSCVSSSSSFRWDFISQPKKQSSVSAGGSAAASGGSGNTIGSNLGGDPLLLARRCANCDTTSTPLWRNGPRGPKSLCNACGIRYKKEERRAAASPSSSTTSGVTAAGDQAIGYGYYRQPPPPPQHQQHSSWVGGCYTSSTPSKSGSASIYDAANEDNVPYLSWRLNLVPPTQFPVRDRPTLFQYDV